MSLLDRRALLKRITAAHVAFLSHRAWSSEESKRITVDDVDVFRIKVNRRGNWIIVRLKSNRGLSGLGDASHSGDDKQVQVYLKQFAALLRGRSVSDVEWFRVATAPVIASGGRPAAVAASALEQSLWDIQGQALSVPSYQLFGGALRRDIRLYANINRSTDPRTPDGFAAMAHRAVADGFSAVKLAPFDEIPEALTDDSERARLTEHGIASAEAVRKAIGPDRDLLIDAHSRFNRARGLELAQRLQPLKLYWLEEVTPAKPVEDLAAINRTVTMATAGGESIQGIAGFYPYVKAEAVDIVMPDVKVCGGMLELKKIAALAQGAGLLTSPHGPASPVGTYAAAHVVATVPNFNILEYSYGEVPWRAELVDPPEEVVDGTVTLSERPGLGIRINERVAAKYAV